MGDSTIEGLFTGSRATLVFDDGSEHLSDSLWQDGRRIAGWLRGAGIRHGDRVAVRMSNGPDYVRLLAACGAGGFVLVSVNTRYSDAESRELIERSGASLTVTELPSSWRDVDPIDPAGTPDDPYVVFTTSGTTSRPKMVLHPQRSIAEHATDVAAAFGHDPGSVVLVVMPLCGTFGLASLTGAIAGHSRTVVTDYDLATTAALIERERVTAVNGSDDLFHRLLEHGTDVTSVRLGGYARFNTSLDGIVARADDAGATLTGLYGMSEVQALFALRDPSAGPADRSRAGGTLTSPRSSYRVVDGELQVRGPSLFTGYLTEGGDHIDDELTERHHDDGWFRTGDLAEAQGERAFEYVSRLGDVLRLGGFLVAPAEIEAILLAIDGVVAAEVVAVDRPGGARPVAFVIAPDGFDETAATTLCRARLARYKVPARILTIDAFPTTPGANGTKIQKVRLRELAAAALT
ncbi:MAG TPA: AMP-binding protein [Ilumatobacter sp.]|nr:AMP-binding protein [Ilumatobacter sp.]